MSFIRWGTGTDWESYYAMYEWIKRPFNDFNYSIEWGYGFVCHFSKWLVDSYTFSLFLFSTILYYFYYKCLFTLSPFVLLSIFLSFCLGFANIFYVRITIACVIALYSVKYIRDRKLIKFLITLALASLFHWATVIFIFAYGLWNKHLNIKRIMLVFLVCVLVGGLLFKSIMGVLGSLDSMIIFSKIGGYLEQGKDDNSMAYSTSVVILKGFINRALLVLLFLFFLNKARQTDSYINGLLNLYLFGTFIYVLMLPLSITMARLALCYDLTQLFLIPYVFKQVHKRNAKILFFVVISVYFFSRFLSTIYAYYDEYVPYKTIFS